MAKKNKIRHYVATELYTSGDVPDFIKDLCEREPTSYRQTKPAEALSSKEKRDGREKVTSKGKMITMVDGEQQEKEIDLVSFDKPGWRYYVEFETIKDMHDFFDEINEHIEIPAFIKFIDPDHCEFCAELIEVNLGLEECPEGSYLIYFADEFLLGDDMEFEGVEE